MTDHSKSVTSRPKPMDFEQVYDILDRLLNCQKISYPRDDFHILTVPSDLLEAIKDVRTWIL